MAEKLSGVRRAAILTGAILRELKANGFDLDEPLDGAGTTTAQLVRAAVVRDAIVDARTQINNIVFREFDAEAWELIGAFADIPPPQDYGAWHEDDDEDEPIDDPEGEEIGKLLTAAVGAEEES